MFLSKEHLPQVLTADDYKCPRHYERELETMFLPAWQIVATKSDVPRDGDFFTLELFDQPLIVWNSGGAYHTFLNVCPHRFSRIKAELHGCSPNRLQCPYHAWEFDDSGTTRKIPDAPSFKPLTQGALGLKKYRTETCGQLICVNLSDEGPTLKEYLGDVYDVGLEFCSDNRLFAGRLEFEYDVNWKVKVENSIETYHLSQVHQKTFGQTPDADICFHELNPRWTSFTTNQPAGSPWVRKIDDFTHRLVHAENKNEFRHYVVYPYFMFGRARLISWAEAIHPVSATRTRNILHIFSHKSRSGKLSSRLLCRLMAHYARRYAYNTTMEDMVVIKEVQAGLMSSRRPSDGLISIREERCFHFQEYVKNATRPRDANGRGAVHSSILAEIAPSVIRPVEAEAK